MKKITIVSLVILVFVVAAAAQSGRRIKTVPAQPASSPVQGVEESLKSEESRSDESIGYSESAPNAPRSISARNRENKKSKKEEKAAAQKSQPAPANDAGVPDEDIVKVETNLVTIPVSVYDRNGLYIPDLLQKDFKIFENGVEQEIAYFGTSEKPFTVILLIDVSPSTEYKIEEIQQAAIAFVDQLKPQDSVMVIQFDQQVSVFTELTNDRQKIYKAIRRTGFGGGTSLYEAVDFALRKRLDKIEGRKAIVLFTDGVDTTSLRSTFESTVRDAEESDAMIFPIYYNTFLKNSGIGSGGVMSTPPILGLPFPGGRSVGSSSAEYTRGRAYLTELAAATGGRVFRPESTPGGLTTAFEGIAEELRRQYNIGYYPQNEAEAGERKQIKVRVNRPKLVIRSRDSYIVGSSNTASK